MDTLTERETEREDVPRRQDGSIDLNELARGLLEDCLNAVMSEQADELLGEGNRRNGYRERSLKTCVGRITLRIPKLREGTYFPDDVLRPYSRTDRAMVGAIAETYRLGLSHRKIERAASKLGFGELSSSAVSRMCSELDADVDELRGARFDMGFPYLWLDATYVKCRSDGRVQGRAVVTAIAAGSDGSRRFVGLDCVDAESRGSWRAFLLGLRRRGVEGVRCVTSDDHAGLVRAIAEVYPEASWQRCITHLERDVAGRFRRRADRARAMRAVSAVFKERDPGLVRAMYDRAVEEVGAIERRAGELLEDAREDALCYLGFPAEHRLRLRTNNVQERANREIKRRTNAVQVFPSEASLVRLVGAVCADMNDEWAAGHFMDAAGMAGIGAVEPPAQPEEATMERARILIAAAMAEAA